MKKLLLYFLISIKALGCCPESNGWSFTDKYGAFIGCKPKLGNSWEVFEKKQKRYRYKVKAEHNVHYKTKFELIHALEHEAKRMISAFSSHIMMNHAKGRIYDKYISEFFKSNNGKPLVYLLLNKDKEYVLIYSASVYKIPTINAVDPYITDHCDLSDHLCRSSVKKSPCPDSERIQHLHTRHEISKDFALNPNKYKVIRLNLKGFRLPPSFEKNIINNLPCKFSEEGTYVVK